MSFFKRLFGSSNDDEPMGEGDWSYTAGSHGSELTPSVDSAPVTVEAEALINEGRYKDALDLLQSSQPSPGQRACHRLYVVNCKLHLRQVEEARGDLKQLLEDEPDNPDFLISASWAAQLDKDYDKAIALADEALKYSENDPGALNNRGFAKLCAGRVQDAIADFRKAVGVERGFDLARTNLAQAYSILEDYEKVEYEASRLAKKGSRRVAGFILLHHVRQQLGDHPGALEVARTARMAAPRDPNVLGLLLDSLDDLGQEKELADTFAHCRELSLPPSELAELEARMAIRTGDFEAAVRICTIGIQADSEAFALRFHRMSARAALGELEGAWEDHNAFLSSTSMPWRQLGWRWFLLFELRRDEETRRVFEDASSELPPVLRGAGLVNSILGDREKSVAFADMLATKVQVTSTDVANCFVVYFNAGKMERAREFVHQHRRVLPRVQVALYEACLAVHAEEWERADNQLNIAERQLLSSKAAVVGSGPDTLWQYWAALHANRSYLPNADRVHEQSLAIYFLKLAYKAGNWTKRYQWHLPWLRPLRESDEFRKFCGQ